MKYDFFFEETKPNTQIENTKEKRKKNVSNTFKLTINKDTKF